MTKLAIVILNYNGRDHLERFLPSVIQHSSHYDIVVADNGSTDDSITFLKQHYPQLRLIELSENVGYAGGYNQALQQIEAEYYVLLNSDVEVTDHWIEPILQLMDSDETIFACQPKILSYHKKDHFEYAGAAGGFIDYLGYPFCRGRIFNTAEKDQGQYDDSREIFWATGACLFVRAKQFHELGGLDEAFFAHMEEIDLCWRAQNKGFKNYYCGQSKVYHVGGGTLHTESPYKTFLNFRNNLLMLYKNLHPEELKQVLKKRRILDMMAATQLFLSGKAKNARSIYDAYKAVRLMKNNYDSPNNTGLNNNNIYKGSIVKEYFLRGKKTFSALTFKKQQF